jgi:hypothetical protein
MKKYLNILNFKKHNRRLFFNNLIKTENIILIEAFDHPSSQVSYSYFSNILSKLNNAKIVSIFPRRASLKNYIYNLLSPFSPYSIQKSYGSIKLLNPKYKKKICFDISKKIKTKKDVVKISLNKIYIGDLIYDEYLAKYKKNTLDLESKLFNHHLKESVELFYFWYDYITKNQVKALILSHSVYFVGLPGRIANYFDIPVYNVMATASYCLDKNNFLMLSNFKFSRNKFLQLKKNVQKDLISNAKKQISNNFLGLLDIKQLNDRKISQSMFGLINKNKRVLNKNSKFKILIATHCFQDAVHVYGKDLFEDFFEWLDFLGVQSNKFKNYEWYIKIHPALFDKNKETLFYFTKKYPKLILLPKNVTHNQLIYEGIGVVLTVYGSVGHEYPLFGIPVVNASNHGPHDLYKFNFYVKNKKNYLQLIKNLPKLKVNKKKVKKQIYEYFAIRYLTNYNIFKNYNKYPEKYRDITQGSNLYSTWLKEFSLSHHKKVLRDYENFIKNKKFKMFALNNLRKSRLPLKNEVKQLKSK